MDDEGLIRPLPVSLYLEAAAACSAVAIIGEFPLLLGQAFTVLRPEGQTTGLSLLEIPTKQKLDKYVSANRASSVINPDCSAATRTTPKKLYLRPVLWFN